MSPDLKISTQAELQRIYDGVGNTDLPTEVITNSENEILAVYVESGIDFSKLVGVIALKRLLTEHRYSEHSKVRDIVPVHGRYLYPPRMLSLIDTIVRSATNNVSLLATKLKGGADDTSGPRRRDRDLGLHIDTGGSGYFRSPLGGLTVHVIAKGVQQARFGRIKSYEDRLRLLTTGKDERVALAEKLGSPFSEPQTLSPGDVVIFRAYPDMGNDLLPVAHDFTTIGDERIWHSFKPSAGSSEEVMDDRLTVIEQYGLSELGYVA